jgi:hypothetical protein
VPIVQEVQQEFSASSRPGAVKGAVVVAVAVEGAIAIAINGAVQVRSGRNPSCLHWFRHCHSTLEHCVSQMPVSYQCKENFRLHNSNSSDRHTLPKVSSLMYIDYPALC